MPQALRQLMLREKDVRLLMGSEWISLFF